MNKLEKVVNKIEKGFNAISNGYQYLKRNIENKVTVYDHTNGWQKLAIFSKVLTSISVITRVLLLYYGIGFIIGQLYMAGFSHKELLPLYWFMVIKVVYDTLLSYKYIVTNFILVVGKLIRSGLPFLIMNYFLTVEQITIPFDQALLATLLYCSVYGIKKLYAGILSINLRALINEQRMTYEGLHQFFRRTEDMRLIKCCIIETLVYYHLDENNLTYSHRFLVDVDVRLSYREESICWLTLSDIKL